MRDASITVVRRVADREGTPVEELTPLYDAVDPDALDSLVRDASARDREFEVRFRYEGYAVVVHGDGEVELARRDPE